MLSINQLVFITVSGCVAIYKPTVLMGVRVANVMHSLSLKIASKLDSLAMTRDSSTLRNNPLGLS